MACGKWNCEAAIFGQTIAAAFSKDAKPVNPFDHREEREQTEAEKAELAAATERIEELKRQVFQAAQEQHGTR